MKFRTHHTFLCKALLAALLFLPRIAGAVELQVVSSGKYAGTLSAYRVGNVYYLDAKQAGSYYAGQVYWYPVTGRVQMSLRGKQVQFLINSDQARIGEKTVKLSHAVLPRVSRAYIPLDFFMSKDFSDLSGIETQFNPDTGLLALDRLTSVGSLRWFTSKESTRVVLELRGNLASSIVKHGRSGFDVVVPFGNIEAAENIQVHDGIVASLQLRQEAKTARLSVKLAREGARWEVHELAQPRRLAIDIFREGAVASSENTIPGEAGPGTVSAPDPVPETAVSTVEVSGVVSTQTLVRGETGPPASSPEVRKRRIVVDAGHGGKDFGASGLHKTKEKDFNLLVAKELVSLLREEGAFEVLLIREDDTFIPLDERSNKANAFQADLFISLHCNASSRRSEDGFEIYFLSEQASDPESQRVADAENAVLDLEEKLAEDVEATSLLHAMAKTEFINDASELGGLMTKEISNRVDLNNRGLKQAAFYVLRGTNAPAVLVEMGFVTNAKDEAKLGSRKFRKKMAEGIYRGVRSFAQRRGWTTGNPS